MPTEKDPTQEIQTQVLDGIRKSQEAVIDGMRTWAETIQQLVPGSAKAAMLVPASCPSRPRSWTRWSTWPPSHPPTHRGLGPAEDPNTRATVDNSGIGPAGGRDRR